MGEGEQVGSKKDEQALEIISGGPMGLLVIKGGLKLFGSQGLQNQR
jgi:hypothetical protein